MFSYFHTKKAAFFNIALLFLIVATWCFFYMFPVLRCLPNHFLNTVLTEDELLGAEMIPGGFYQTEYLMYGKVNYAAIPSLFGGSDIPFLDKTYFRMNDDEATYVLYASADMLEEMSDWFSFGAVNVNELPLEVRAIRLGGGDRYLVTSFSTSYGSLNRGDLGAYMLSISVVGLGVEVALFLCFLIFVVLGIKAKRRSGV